MTSETHAKQPSKRFAKLDAIPRHKPIGGLRATIARLYIARKATMSFVAVAVVAGGAGAYLMQGSTPSDPLDIAVAEIEKPTETAIPVEIAAAVEAAKIERIGDGLQKTDGTDTAEAPVEQTEEPSKAESAFKIPALPEAKEAAPIQEQDKAAVRQIIPIAEGLDLYRSAEPLEAKAEEEVATATVAGEFTLPSSGVPTEDDMAGFLKTQMPDVEMPRSTEIAIIPPEEDLSPTIKLPDIVPTPVAKPVPELAKGTKVEFHIVQGQGVKSGFWLGNKKDASARRFFVVVAPQLENGDVTKWKFTNIADGSPENTDLMAVEVTEDAFLALAKESKEFGRVRNPVLGRGEIGDKNVKWRVASVGGNLIAGWDRETGR